MDLANVFITVFDFPLTSFPVAVDLQTQPPQQNDQQDSEGGCMC